jgi:DNA-binding NtrC family response regulator
MNVTFDSSSKKVAVTPRQIPPLPAARRILLVDDDTDALQYSMAVLTAAGYLVEGVKDGTAGWKALLVNKYDLLMTDNKMPKMTGIEMIDKIRSANMAIPVILATGALPLHDFAHNPWLRPDAMLQRPFSSDQLLETVRNFLGTDDGNARGKETLPPQRL